MDYVFVNPLLGGTLSKQKGMFMSIVVFGCWNILMIVERCLLAPVDPNFSFGTVKI